MICKKTYLIIGVAFILLGCHSTQEAKPERTTKEPTQIVNPFKKEILPKQAEVEKEDFTALKFNVSIGISAQRPRWILFKNGTYVIFPDGYTDAQIKEKAIQLLNSHTNEQIAIKKSNFAKGWIGSTSKGVYTYIKYDDLGAGIPENSRLVAQARQNIRADKAENRVVHINRKKE